MRPTIEYELLTDGHDIIGLAPERGNANASGIDVFVPNGLSFDIYPKADVIIPLYIRLKIPDGYDVEVKNKSSVATQKKLVKGAQLIDVDYRGNIRIHVFNLGRELVRLNPGDKIAQLVVRPVLISEWKEVDDIDIDTDRGEDWNGSTDKKKCSK